MEVTKNMVDKNYNPLIEAVPPEIPLSNSPLVRVISQVRFPIIVSIEKREFIGPFQEAIRDTYPVLRVEQTRGIIMGPEAIEPTQSNITWRFSDMEGKWRASLAPGFVALETTSYTSRSDFLERFRILLEAVNTHIGPKLADRLGIRYIDRVTGDQVQEIARLVRKEILGILATPAGDCVQHALSESIFKVPNSKAQMLARWGQLPPDVTPDPGAIEPVSGKTWILDIDMFCVEPRPFDTVKLIDETHNYAERVYAFFRWAVTEDFLRLYGGKL
jgi:uncharacterized protein (TIGR04255 family)